MRFVVALAFVVGSTGVAGAHESTLHPRNGRVVVVTTSIEIIDTISWLRSSARIAPTSNEMLDAIADTLNGNPSIELIEVQAHASLADLADRRARNVVEALVRRGVAPHRLQPVGIRSGKTHTAFLIVRRSTD
jgi:hypothetical protein